MFERPKLRASARLDVVAPDLAVARSEDRVAVFEGRLVPLLAPWLDGRRTVAEIAAELAGRAHVVDLRFGLSLLAEKDLLVEGTGAVGGDTGAFLDALGAGSAACRERLERAAVEVAALGSLATGPLASALDALGIRVAAGGELLVVLARDYTAPELAEIHRRELAAGRPWLLVKPVGTVPWIGPLLRPPETACWQCLARRLADNRPYPELLARALGGDAARFAVPAPALPATLALAANAAAVQVLRWIAEGRNPELEGRLIALDTRTLTGGGHRLLRRPACRCCAPPPPPAEPRPVRLARGGRRVATDGGYRTVPADLTCRRFAHLVSPITGLVGRLRDHGGGSAALRLYVADYAFRNGDEDQALRSGQRRHSAGKGLSDEQARASALGEALERHSGVYRGDEPTIRARFVDLGDQAIHPNACMGYSPAQYRDRARWAGISKYAWVPVPFDREREVDWSPLWSLSEECFKYLPAAYCYYSYPLPADHRFCAGDSNGSAAGSCVEEAILQGFLELVERDAVAVWWYNRLPRPGVDLASFDEPRLAAIQNLHRELGRELHVLDLGHDLGVPTFAAVSWTAAEKSHLLLGFGAHFEAGIALARALTEVNQFLPGAGTGRERRILSAPPAELTYLRPAGSRRRQDYPPPPAGDLRAAVRHAVALAAARGLETLVLDQTRSDVGLPVVKVVVPGLRSHWPRWGPGRLYQVPVAAGWLDRPRREDQLNPAHLLI